MKKLIIVHGWDGSPNEPLLQWLKTSLEEKGYEVSVPTMPDAETPKIILWIEKLKEVVGTPDSETVLFGHSIGCQAVLRYLETLPNDVSVAGAVFLAPWMQLDKETIAEEGEESVEIARPWVETPIDFQKVRKQIGKSIAIFSDNDPFVPLGQKELFRKELGSEIIVEKEKGHFTVSDGIKELPSALDAVLGLTNSK